MDDRRVDRVDRVDRVVRVGQGEWVGPMEWKRRVWRKRLGQWQAGRR
jgi:hypothetical protein